MTSLINTVMHAGTLSLKADLMPIDTDIWHCGEDYSGRTYDKIYTTRRDPLRVAASWANRGLSFDGWEGQWAAWGSILHLAEVVDVSDLRAHENRHPDTLGLHAALDRGDMAYYHRHVPAKYIDIARKAHG